MLKNVSPASLVELYNDTLPIVLTRFSQDE